MSTREIIAELPKLSLDDLRLIKQKVAELESAELEKPRSKWGTALLGMIGTANDLPPDLSINHDHYLYGAPKQE